MCRALQPEASTIAAPMTLECPLQLQIAVTTVPQVGWFGAVQGPGNMLTPALEDALYIISC